MDPLTLLTTCLLALLFGTQAWLALRATKHFGSMAPEANEQGSAEIDFPHALVVLCLRGGDPFLKTSLRMLANQDYPSYNVRIVVDSATDTAHQTLQDVFSDNVPQHVEIVSLGARYATCTYKLSGILFATATVPDATQIVAFMDGDTVPHATWLKELVRPIAIGKAGVSTGNRWYCPTHASAGSMARFFWNLAAFPVMTFLKIPWGGTMAIRADLIQDGELRERLQHAFSDDTTIGQFARDRQEVIAIPPTLVVLNREDTSLSGLFRFLVRQLMTVRLNHRSWRFLSVHSFFTTAALLHPLWRLIGLRVTWVADVTFVIGFLGLRFIELRLGKTIRKVLATRGESITGWNEVRRCLRACGTAVVFPPLYLLVVLTAAFAKRVHWRGVTYRIGRNRSLLVERDHWATPTPQPALPANSNAVVAVSAEELQD